MSEVEEIETLLNQIRAFDMDTLPRSEDLGKAFNFSETVAPARKVQNLFNGIPSANVLDISAGFRDTLLNHLRNFSDLLDEIRSFDPEEETAGERASLINRMSSFYDTAFDSLHPVVAFLSTKNVNLSNIESEAKIAASKVVGEIEAIQNQLAQKSTEADKALSEIRKVAAEQGVSQQAHYFKGEADRHDAEVTKWQTYTVWTSIGLGTYCILAMTFSIFYTPENSIVSAQIALSKTLLFGVIAYMLFFCSRTLMAHRHNSVINRHRENALLTFNALVEAAGTEEKRDIVLTHAAGCIFAPQDTGYIKSASGPQFSSANIIEALPRLAHQV